MKKLLLLALLSTILQGCGSYRPNTQKGWHLDEINKHTRNINRLDPVIYQQNQTIIPQRVDQLSDTASWQDRMKSRMDSMKGRK